MIIVQVHMEIKLNILQKTENKRSVQCRTVTIEACFKNNLQVLDYAVKDTIQRNTILDHILHTLLD